jgi:hypothetical protein
MERALSGKATNDDIVLYNAVSREKNEFWSTVDPTRPR